MGGCALDVVGGGAGGLGGEAARGLRLIVDGFMMDLGGNTGGAAPGVLAGLGGGTGRKVTGTPGGDTVGGAAGF